MKSGGLGRLLMYGVIGASLLTLFFVLLTPGGVESLNRASLPPDASPLVDKSLKAQSKRSQFIAALRTEGLLGKVECRSQVADMWVTARFLDMSFDNKQTIAGVIHAYCFDRSDGLATVTLRDDRTGKQVGHFSQVGGGLKMK